MYLIFGGKTHYPLGGKHDLQGVREKILLAMTFARELTEDSLEWAHVIDGESGGCVAEYGVKLMKTKSVVKKHEFLIHTFGIGGTIEFGYAESEIDAITKMGDILSKPGCFIESKNLAFSKLDEKGRVIKETTTPYISFKKDK